MSETGRELKENNEKIVYYLNFLKTQRKEIDFLIEKQEEEKNKLEMEIERVYYKLQLISKSLAMRKKARIYYDQTIKELEENYKKIVESSGILLKSAQMGADQLTEIMDKKTGTGSVTATGQTQNPTIEQIKESTQPLEMSQAGPTGSLILPASNKTQTAEIPTVTGETSPGSQDDTETSSANESQHGDSSPRTLSPSEEEHIIIDHPTSNQASEQLTRVHSAASDELAPTYPNLMNQAISLNTMYNQTKQKKNKDSRVEIFKMGYQTQHEELKKPQSFKKGSTKGAGSDASSIASSRR